MVRKLLLAGFLLFVGVPALVLMLEHGRGRRELDATLADLQARGEVTELARLVPAPVPIASNGLASLITAADRLQGAGDLLPPSIQLIAPATAFPPTRMESWPSRSSRGSASNTWASAEKWIAAHGADYNALYDALALPYRRPRYEWERGNQMLLPHLAKFKTAANALSLAIATDARRGDAAAAAEGLRAIRILEDDLAEDPVLIAQLVRTACASIASSRLWQVAHARDWSESDLAMLQEALEPSELSDGLAHSLVFERSLLLYDLRRLSAADFFGLQQATATLFSPSNPSGLNQVPESLEEAAQMAGSVVERLAESLRSRVIFPLWRFAWGDQAIVYYLRVMDDLIQVHREAVRLHSVEPLKAFNLADRLTPKALGDHLRQIYARMLVPALERALLRTVRQETERDLLRTGIALRRFQLRHHRLPVTLQELVPDFLPAVPLDRMDGKPLRYRRDSDTRFTLWSIGEDGTDQDGDATWSQRQGLNPQWWLGEDAVWPQPADEAQAAEWLRAEEQKTARKNTVQIGSSTNGSAFLMNPELMKRYGLLPWSGTNAPAAPPQEAPKP